MERNVSPTVSLSPFIWRFNAYILISYQYYRAPTISVSADDGGSWSDLTSPPPASAKPTRGLALTKEAWESEEASEDVLNNLLRVKKLSQRVSSIESKKNIKKQGQRLTFMTR